MIATYKPSKEGMMLNIREAPNGRCVDKMVGGESAEVEIVERGWCKIPKGYIDARKVVITDGELDETIEPVGDPEPPQEPEDPEEPEAPEGDAIETVTTNCDFAAELRKMTNPQLYDLAVQSGINVKKGANKEALIEAILAAEDE